MSVDAEAVEEERRDSSSDRSLAELIESSEFV